jgi:hypothetical protein
VGTSRRRAYVTPKTYKYTLLTTALGGSGQFHVQAELFLDIHDFPCGAYLRTEKFNFYGYV